MSSTTSDAANDRDRVGPVLHTGALSSAVLAAIADLNSDVQLVDRGSYVRVLVPGRCVVTRAAVEKHLSRPFELLRELEAIMPSFKGFLSIDEDRAVWEFRR